MTMYAVAISNEDGVVIEFHEASSVADAVLMHSLTPWDSEEDLLESLDTDRIVDDVELEDLIEVAYDDFGVNLTVADVQRLINNIKR